MECQWCPEGYCERPAPPPTPATAPAARDDALPAGVADDFRPDPELVKRLPQVIRSQTGRFCDLLGAATAGSPITPKDLTAGCGMGKTWVFDRLAALADLGLVTQVSRGRYAATPGADIAAGLAEIRARADRLAAEARQLIDAQ